MHSSSYLIADAGSTKTDWVIVHPPAGYQRIQSAGINPFYQTAEEIIPLLENEVVPYAGDHVEHIYFFGAGCADDRSGQPVTAALRACFPKVQTLEVASDMLGAARGLCGREPGLACILGTGANNAFYDGRQIVRSIGSLGFWLGDEGSGSYLGKTLVVHYLQNELPAELHEAFAAAYPGINRLSVLENAYRKPYPNRYFAAFSTFIAGHIAHPFMRGLVKEAFSLFVKKYICKHPDTASYPVHFTGSVAYYYQDILREVLESHALQCGHILRSPLEGLVQYYGRDRHV
ncbi:N-acetylglucosamine kinase [Dyadobacter sandarakinus]|uniref:N-acetylglucosamine kinase n=2 Tax=Dyadobacter sandarakinus TaxID=2747268 RepID=A0ABX7IHE8_9BACT|nr:N-acetylglucosamine kinase [Dyadobacter sandarakinus]